MSIIKNKINKMKKIVVIGIAILMMIVSCKKKENVVSQRTTPPPSTSMTSYRYAMLLWNRFGSDTIYPSNCWFSINNGPHIIVSASQFTAYDLQIQTQGSYGGYIGNLYGGGSILPSSSLMQYNSVQHAFNMGDRITVGYTQTGKAELGIMTTNVINSTLGLIKDSLYFGIDTTSILSIIVQ